MEKNAVESIYQYSKHCGEILCRFFVQNYNLKIKIIRPSTLFGVPDFDTKGVLNKFIKAAIENTPIQVYQPSKIITFTNVSEIEKVIRNSLDSTPFIDEANEPINLVSPEQYTLMELAQIVKLKLRSRSQIICHEEHSYIKKEKAPNIKNRQFSKTKTPLLVDWLEEI